MYKEDNNKRSALLKQHPFTKWKTMGDMEKSIPTYMSTPSINTTNERRPSIGGGYICRSESTRTIDERYERTDGVVKVERPALRKSDVSPSSITPIVLFNIAMANGTFAQSLVSRNGFAIGNYYRYWQNLFDLRPCPSIYAITVTYEILGKEGCRNFLLKNFEEKFIWLRDSLPLGFMYDKSHGPLAPPTTIEIMFAFGEKSWINGNALYLVRYTRNAKVYMKDLNLCTSDDMEDLPPLDLNVLNEAISDIIDYY
ncbi:hypothetical protein H8356DRAFT_1729992 [Neocallimastix lanati (nom. inval.)]|jgi:hypothetical protein|uniref:Uncharacterized protein n=1 Tax=Neocallimastix californiae TaxID=1754190 RepID=A0A1Y2DFB8_9FUNG|nr:hypothetical protein H8356DRAFT_1729992 [Neocallimastix sp. JGI-2020a]ORY57375.1 hypothetical protein LY90DRAFT_644834 [Neocallimastix californiae]|eukprot:ORY57375.1 hypothetical protein LY90DRAFT_644834 [Neocallimastix californiae]